MHYFYIVCFSLLPIISLFSGQALVPILIVMTLVSSLISRLEVRFLKEKLIIFISTIQGKIFILAVLFALMGAFWSIIPAKSAINSIRIIVLIGIGAVFWRVLSFKKFQFNTTYVVIVVAGLVLACAIAYFDFSSEGLASKAVLFYKLPSEYSASTLNRGAVYISFCLWAALILLYKEKLYVLAFSVLGVVTYTILTLESLTASLSLIAAIICFGCCYLFKDRIIKAMTLFMIVGVIATPVIATSFNPLELSNGLFSNSEGSIKHRLFIWDFVAKKAMEKPILGWGFDSARAIPVTKQDEIPDCWGAEIVTKKMNHCRWDESSRPHPLPLHPHNGTLQIWLELGVIGLIFYILIIGYAGFKIANTNLQPMVKYGYFSLFVQFIAVQQTGFGIWQNWLWAAFILALLQIKIASNASAPASALR